jgi:hypothetical protein
MDRAADGGAGWRNYVKTRLAGLGILWADPVCKPTTMAKEDPESRAKLNAAKERGDYNEVCRAVKEIRCVDLRLVDITDFLIVNIDTEVYAFGTIEEITTANRSKKPIIVHVEQGKKCAPGWLFGMIPHETIFSTWDEVCDYLQHIDRDLEIDLMKRWYFFNFESK